MSSKKIAIDIVLLPPDEIMKICFEVNKNDPSRYMTFNISNVIPHISLLMGIINKNNIKEISLIILMLAKKIFADQTNNPRISICIR